MCWVDFGEPIGSEPGYRRPALVVSSDRFNRSRISTVVVSAVTSNLRLASVPGTVGLDRGTAGLPKPSVVNLSQTLVVDRARVVTTAGSLDRALMRHVDEALRLVLGL